MVSRGSTGSDAIEIDGGDSDEDSVVCWTSDQAANAPVLLNPDGGIRQRVALIVKDEAKEPNGLVSPSTIRKTSVCSVILVEKTAPATSQDENRREIGRCADASAGQTNLLSWIGSSKSTTSSDSAAPTRQMNAATNSNSLRARKPSSKRSVPTSGLSLSGDKSSGNSAILAASTMSRTIRQGNSQEQHALGISELAMSSRKRKVPGGTLSIVRNSDVASYSDDESKESDSSFCVIDDGPRRRTFGEQRSSIGYTVDDAISVHSSSDSDEACTRFSPNGNRAAAPSGSTEYAGLLLRRQERNRRIAITRARNARSKELKRKSSILSDLDANNTLSVFEARKESDSNPVGIHPNVAAKQSPSPVRKLRVVPSFGRSSRALQGTRADGGFGARATLNSTAKEDCNKTLPKSAASLAAAEESGSIDTTTSCSLAASCATLSESESKKQSLSPGVVSNLLEAREIDVKPIPLSPLPSVDFSTFFQDDDSLLEQMSNVADSDDVLDDNDDIELGAWAVCVTVRANKMTPAIPTNVLLTFFYPALTHVLITNGKHLSRKSLHPTSQLPFWEFTIHGGDDSILYVFRTFVAPSKIAGGGSGAFIEFLGARRLNSIALKRRHRLNEEMTYVDVKTRDLLQAEPDEKGSGISVKLTGKDLHSEGNGHYVPKRGLRKIRAVYKDKSVSVRIVGANIHDLPEFDAYFISESSPLNSIGFLGTQISCEYAKDPTIDRFKMDDNCIDLGRYGPFRKEDRLPEDAFILKSFIFSNEPEEWCFTIDEPLHDMLQYIDITSHDTGEPSPFAKAEIPMYVNEIGHSDQLQQNVWIRDSPDGRVVGYYFKGELQKGEPVELLTNYKAIYENVRERKGYGLRNVHEGLPSDSSIAERLQRGFDTRDIVLDTIQQTESVVRLRYLLGFIETAIWQPIVSKAHTFLRHHHSGHGASSLSPKQWAAVRRSYWVASHFLKKIEKEKLKTIDKSLFSFYEFTIKERLHANETKIGSSILPVLSLGCEVLGTKVFEVLEYENLEEIYYGVRDKLLMVHNASVYCPIARALMDQLCRHLAPCHSLGIVDDKKTRESLVGCFYERALEAKQEILRCIEMQNFSELQFSSGVLMKSRLAANSDKLVSMLRSSRAFFLQNSTVPKGIIAAFMDNLHYQELADLADTSFFDSQTGGCISDRVVMVRYNGITGNDLDEVKALASIPIDISRIRASSQVNDAWYIQTQVVWIVDVLASYYLRGTSYSLCNLAAYLNVNNRHSEFVSTRGLDLVHASRFDKYLTTETPRETKSDPPKSMGCHTSEAKEPTSGKRVPSVSSKTSKSIHASRFDEYSTAEATRETKDPTNPKESHSSEPKEPTTGKRVPTVSSKKSKSVGQRRTDIFVQPPQAVPVRKGPKLVYEGPPTCSRLEGRSWPPNWIQRSYERQGGASKGDVDHYWFPPTGVPRLRSKTEVERYINARQSQQDMLTFVPR